MRVWEFWDGPVQEEREKKFQIRLFAVTVGRRDVVTSCPMRCDHRRDANPPNVQHSIFTLNNAIRPCRL